MTVRRLVASLCLCAPTVLATCSKAPGGDADEVALITAPVCVEHSPTLLGIDVSKYQGDIDWQRVKADGIEYAFIRVSDGISTIDEKFPQNWQGAKDAGIPRGVYQFFRPNRDAAAQAQIVLDHLAQYGMGELPPVIDVEATGDQSAAAIAADVGTWIDAIEGTLNVRPIIYAGSYFWDDNVGSDAFADYPYWIPHYTSAACPRLAAPWSDWDFWQYSSTGSVDGIVGNVDMDRYAGTREELLALVPDERCRLTPTWRACVDDVVSECVDGRVEESACGAGSSCVGDACALDPVEPGPEVVEAGPELVEVVEQVEAVESIDTDTGAHAEVVEPEPDAVGPEDTASFDTAPPVDTTTGGAHAVAPTHSISRRVIQPGGGCDAGGATNVGVLTIGLALTIARRRRRAE